MKQVMLKPLLHRNDERIGVYFKHDASLNNLVKKLPEIKWSQSNRCWHLPLKEEVYKQIQSALNKYAEIDRSALKLYLEKRKTVVATIVTSSEKKITSKPISSLIAWKLSNENIAALEKFIEQLKLKSYSPSTIRTYRNEFLQLLQLLKTKPVNELTPDNLRRYMVYAMEKEGIKENTAHSRLNALKFYFEQVLRREKFFWDIPRPKKPVDLPKVFNQDEVAAIINSIKNKKHK